MIAKATIKKSVRRVGRTNDITGTDATTRKSSALIPNVFKIEYTVSIYATIEPKIISIHAASLILGHNKIAKNAAIAPRISWLKI